MTMVMSPTRRRSIPTATRARRELLLRVMVVVGLVLAFNRWASDWLTEREAALSAVLTDVSGGDDIQHLVGSSVVIIPFETGPIAAQVSASCSSLTSVIALVGLSIIVMGGSLRRRIFAGIVASVVVFVGNLIRISVVLHIGQIRGVSALVLFHDWIGTMFSITYTLLGFAILLALRMPGRRQWESTTPRTFGL
jgi:exosortase/archaeosortase family protein